MLAANTYRWLESYVEKCKKIIVAVRDSYSKPGLTQVSGFSESWKNSWIYLKVIIVNFQKLFSAIAKTYGKDSVVLK